MRLPFICLWLATALGVGAQVPAFDAYLALFPPLAADTVRDANTPAQYIPRDAEEQWLLKPLAAFFRQSPRPAPAPYAQAHPPFFIKDLAKRYSETPDAVLKRSRSIAPGYSTEYRSIGKVALTGGSWLCVIYANIGMYGDEIGVGIVYSSTGRVLDVIQVGEEVGDAGAFWGNRTKHLGNGRLRITRYFTFTNIIVDPRTNLLDTANMRTTLYERVSEFTVSSAGHFMLESENALYFSGQFEDATTRERINIHDYGTAEIEVDYAANNRPNTPIQHLSVGFV